MKRLGKLRDGHGLALPGEVEVGEGGVWELVPDGDGGRRGRSGGGSGDPPDWVVTGVGGKVDGVRAAGGEREPRRGGRGWTLRCSRRRRGGRWGGRRVMEEVLEGCGVRGVVDVGWWRREEMGRQTTVFGGGRGDAERRDEMGRGGSNGGRRRRRRGSRVTLFAREEVLRFLLLFFFLYGWSRPFYIFEKKKKNKL